MITYFGKPAPRAGEGEAGKNVEEREKVRKVMITDDKYEQ
jgi:hypothetical protein